MLILENVHFGYESGEAVVRGLTAELKPGRVCILLGPNAAGKSTLLKLMLGFLAPDQGSCALAGLSVSAMDAGQRAIRLAYVPQRPRTHVAFTVEQVVAMGRFALPNDESAVRQAIERYDLQPLRARVFAELSVGQQQRVALARAVAQCLPAGRKPAPFLLADEPVSAMDLKHVHQTMVQLKMLAAEGVGVLAVLHDVNLAAMYADEVWLMHEGRLAASGPAAQVLQPATLEPVYGVRLSTVAVGDSAQPMLFVDQSRRLC